MAIWDKAKDASVDARRKDEEYHARAMHEVQSGQRRDGLWAKAVTSTGGDEAAAKLAYFKLLVQAIRDDDHIAMRSGQAEPSIAQQPLYQSPPPPSPPIPGSSQWNWMFPPSDVNRSYLLTCVANGRDVAPSASQALNCGIAIGVISRNPFQPDR